MPKLIMLKGLPASGKSSRAKNLIKTKGEQYKRVNKDTQAFMAFDAMLQKLQHLVHSEPISKMETSECEHIYFKDDACVECGLHLDS